MERWNVSRSILEDELVRLDLRRVLALLRKRVLHLEQIRKVAADVDPNDKGDRFRVVIQEGELFAEAVADRALTNH